MKILFVCECNLNRSPTFERYFREHYPQHEYRSAGTLYGYPYQVNQELLNWANMIFVMDLKQAKFIWNKYKREVKVIGVSDEYHPDDINLISLIQFWLNNCSEITSISRDGLVDIKYYREIFGD